MDQIIKSRGINWLYHFTKSSNLDGILRHGLLSRVELHKLKIPYECNDQSRWDNKLDRISCSVMWPNYKLLYKNRTNCNTDKYLIIKIRADVLNKLDCVFTPENAAKKEYRNNFYELKGDKAFNSLFSDKVGNFCRTKKTRTYWPTDAQAEVLVATSIPLEYIDKIICKDDQTLKELKAKHPEHSDLFTVYQNYLFGNRPDWTEQNVTSTDNKYMFAVAGDIRFLSNADTPTQVQINN